MNSKSNHFKNNLPKLLASVFVLIGLVLLAIYSMHTGSISLPFKTLLRGLFIEYKPEVAVVYDLRFPRIIVSMMSGSLLAVSGVLFQAVLKNPLADPGILGISSGANLAVLITTMLAPNLFYFTPLFGFLGGLITYFFIYTLSIKETASPIRLILMGIAMQSLLSGLTSALHSISGSNSSTVSSIVEGNLTMKTWNDVHLLFIITCIGLLLAFFSSHYCNLCGLDDKTIRGLGVNIEHVRLIISLIAVLIVAGCTAIVGPISFLGLLVPHIGRIIVGNNHWYLTPFSALLGAFLFLAADTFGRTIVYPYEISASIILSVLGGITFIILLRKNGGIYGK